MTMRSFIAYELIRIGHSCIYNEFKRCKHSTSDWELVRYMYLWSDGMLTI